MRAPCDPPREERFLFSLVTHLYRVWRAGQLRVRLEAFGLYYPQLPYQAPWWRVSPRSAILLARQLGSYARWVVEMERLRRGGAAAWWAARLPTSQRLHDEP